MLQWIIFINVNPVELKYDNKLTILEQMPHKYTINQQRLLKNTNLNNIYFPIIIKPTIYTGNGVNVFLVNSKKELEELLKCKKIDESVYMVQEYLGKYPIELEILYEKLPWENKGKIISIVEKLNKHDPIRDFDDKFMYSHKNMINEKITRIFENLTNKIKNLNVARYCIRLKKIKDLNKNKFKIVEIGGTMAADLENIIHFKWFIRRFMIGLYNVACFNGYSLFHLISVLIISYYRSVIGNDWVNLYSLYS
jgi:hypothetical protein